MKPNIKLRNISKGTTKTVNRAGLLAERTREAYKTHGNPNIESAEDYTADQITDTAEDLGLESAYLFNKHGSKSVRGAVRNVPGHIKSARESIKTAEATGKEAIKTTKAAVKRAKQYSKSAYKSSKRAAQVTKVVARKLGQAAKLAAKATVAAGKAVIAGAKALVYAIAAGGWVAVVIILLVCMVAMIAGSCFGIFLSGDSGGTNRPIQEVIREIDADYQAQIQAIEKSIAFNHMDVSGSKAEWAEVLAVYAVKTTTDPENAKEVATVDTAKALILKDIFWQMNTIESETVVDKQVLVTETTDEDGNVSKIETTIETVYLNITTTHKTAEEMADYFAFNDEQRKQLAELLSPENESIWNAIIP